MYIYLHISLGCVREGKSISQPRQGEIAFSRTVMGIHPTAGQSKHIPNPFRLPVRFFGHASLAAGGPRTLGDVVSRPRPYHLAIVSLSTLAL